jgi:GMP synthase-like glutamine amidotransferase
VKPVAVLQFYKLDGVGFFGEHLRGRGVAMQVFDLFDGQAAPSGLGAFGGLCLLGGPMSVNDDWAALREGERLIREALRLEVPVFGHCLGGQLMSRALGGSVVRAPRAEVGWSHIEARDDPLARHWFGRPGFPMFQWHNETFSVPAAARLIATGAHCPSQAFALGALHIGVQFHCEIDRGKIEAWLRKPESDDIERYAGSPAVQDAETIRAGMQAHLAAAQQTAAFMYDRWLERLAP